MATAFILYLPAYLGKKKRYQIEQHNVKDLQTDEFLNFYSLI